MIVDAGIGRSRDGELESRFRYYHYLVNFH